MTKKKISVQGMSITIEQIKEDDYISLTDIAKINADDPAYVIQNWMKNNNTIRYLYRWEEIHNDEINPIHLDDLLKTANDNRRIISPKMWIETVNAIGMRWKTGRGGGTMAHKDIALNFCYWLSPEFQIYLIKEFQRLKEDEFSKMHLEWHVERITNLVDETRNWLDTIPGQSPGRNRLNIKGKEED
ncbi:MAG: KilA-N domain-containing protein [Bacteroidetes bacterium]|nr:KilA-N domain-containing protein [Bacteroidota bacterium]